MNSPIVVGEDGTGAPMAGAMGGYEFGVDPNEDPELALVKYICQSPGFVLIHF
jgi:26S proteasome regulatory subunit N10